MLESLRRRGVTVLPVAGVDSSLAALRAGDVDLLLARGFGFAPDDDVATLAVLVREEPRDVLIPANGTSATLATLPAGSRVGAGGLRRRSFLRAHRSDLVPVPPGNGGGPAHAIRSGSVDALVLGAAEARRLSLGHLASEALDPKAWVPSAGQGSLVLLGRRDGGLPEGVFAMDHAPSRAALAAEVACVAELPGGADGPVGVLAVAHGQWIRIWGMVASADGRHVVRGDITGSMDNPEAAGAALAEVLLARGAGALIARGDQP